MVVTKRGAERQGSNSSARSAGSFHLPAASVLSCRRVCVLLSETIEERHKYSQIFKAVMMEINEHDKMVTNFKITSIEERLENIRKRQVTSKSLLSEFFLKSIFKRTMNLIRIGMHVFSYERLQLRNFLQAANTHLDYICGFTQLCQIPNHVFML